MINTELQLFYQDNPKATIQDYFAYMEEKYRKERENNIKKDEWYNKQLGKYYFVNHNGTSKKYYKLTSRRNLGFVSKDTYSVSSRGCMEIDHDTYFNELWLNNPYDKQSNKGCVEVKEITEKEFNEVVDKFNKFNELVKEVFDLR